MNISLRQMRAFLMVAELSSFTRASERIHLSQAALSLMIREFEEQIGFKVFERSTRAVDLNMAGKGLYPVILKTVRDIEDAVAKASRISKNQDNLVRVAATSTVSTNILPGVISLMSSLYPDIEFDVHDVDRSSINELLDNDGVDVGLCLDGNVEQHFRKIKIGSCGILAIARDESDYLKITSSGDFSFIEDSLLYCLSSDNPVQKVIDGIIFKSCVFPRRRNVFSNINTILAMIEANGGYAILPSFTLEACKRFKIKTVVMQGDFPDFDFVAMTKRNSSQKASVDIFVEFFSKYMEDYLV